MTGILILLLIALLLLDGVVISDARRLLMDFLIGQRNRKNARKIHAQQTLRDRITLRYIKTMLKKYRSAFEKFYLLYMVLLVTLLPQYAAAIASCVVLGDSARYVLYGFLIVKALLAVFYRLQFDSLHISVYAKK